eukprot:gene29581-33281_t
MAAQSQDFSDVYVAPSAAANVQLGVVFAVLSALVFFTHRANLARLIAGTEPRIGAG